MTEDPWHLPCHTDDSPWDDDGRHHCGCRVQDLPDCLACERPYHEAHPS